MIGREPILPYGYPMLARGVALVFSPAIHGILLGYAHHILIAVGLGKHRGSSDIGILAIALNYCAPRCCKVGVKAVAIHNDILWCGA